MICAKNRIANSDRLHKESIMSLHIKQTNQRTDRPTEDTLTLIIVFCVSIKYGLLLLLLLFYSSMCLSFSFGRHFPLAGSLTICGQLQIRGDLKSDKGTRTHQMYWMHKRWTYDVPSMPFTALSSLQYAHWEYSQPAAHLITPRFICEISAKRSPTIIRQPN